MLQPSLELRRLWGEEPLQKISPVVPQRLLPTTLFQSRLEFLDIAPDERRIDPQFVLAPALHTSRPQGLPEAIESLPESRPGLLRGRVRPEEPHYPLPPHESPSLRETQNGKEAQQLRPRKDRKQFVTLFPPQARGPEGSKLYHQPHPGFRPSVTHRVTAP